MSCMRQVTNGRLVSVWGGMSISFHQVLSCSKSAVPAEAVDLTELHEAGHEQQAGVVTGGALCRHHRLKSPHHLPRHTTPQVAHAARHRHQTSACGVVESFFLHGMIISMIISGKAS